MFFSEIQQSDNVNAFRQGMIYATGNMQSGVCRNTEDCHRCLCSFPLPQLQLLISSKQSEISYYQKEGKKKKEHNSEEACILVSLKAKQQFA